MFYKGRTVLGVDARSTRLRSILLLYGVSLLMLNVWLLFPQAASAVKPASPSAVRWLNLSSGHEATPAAEQGRNFPAHLRIRRVTHDSGGITLYFSVQDGEGEPLTGLRAADFQLQVDGRSEPFTELAVMADLQSEHLVVVLALGFLDQAGHAPLALDAFASTFVAELEESKADLCALLTFRGRISVPRLFSADPLLLKQALSRIHFSGEGLLLNAAITAARTLIYQNDTAGYGVVLLAFDNGDSLASLQPFPSREAGREPGGPAIYALGVDLPATLEVDPLAALTYGTGGESFLVTGDSLALYSAVGRIIRILQRQYVIRLGLQSASRLRLEYAGAGKHSAPSDSILLKNVSAPAAVDVLPGQPHRGLVRISLLVGVALLALIIALHLRNRV